MDDLGGFLDELRRRLDDPARGGAAVAVASIVRHRGSTPRKTGAKMLVDPAGTQVGTVGGGCGEAEVLRDAQRVLATRTPRRIEVSLLEDEEGWESPSICGGVLDVFVEHAAEELGGVPRGEIFAIVDEARARGRGVAIVSVTAAHGSRATLVGRKTLVDDRGVQSHPLGEPELDRAAIDEALGALARGEAGEATVGDDGATRLFVEPLVEKPELVVVGAGHVGQALARLAPQAGFAVTVLDDRASYANPRRIPEARRIVVGDPRCALVELAPHRARYVVLVTRGHRLDADCLRVAVGLELAYLGMIGSRRRVARILEHLAEEGVAAERLARVRTPIGLDIGAETPGEIAVAILAEMIDVRRSGRASAVALSAPPRRG
jgi:xanthine dehydrogenase accessory factor